MAGGRPSTAHLPVAHRGEDSLSPITCIACGGGSGGAMYGVDGEVWGGSEVWWRYSVYCLVPK